ncbi:MAG: hypothetical protein FWG05_01850, partial [Kiritimatiellaeota bacterium]|nr:hypothetical protein [Kiritimatiellota bacterium]
MRIKLTFVKIAAFCVAISVSTGAVFAQQPGNPKEVLFNGDSECGISSDKIYTHAVDLGYELNSPPIKINGVTFYSSRSSADTIPGTSFTWSGAPVTAHPTLAANAVYIGSDNTNEIYKLLYDFNYTNNGQNGNFSIGGLTEGMTYEFRFYQRAWEPAGYGNGKPRVVTLTFRPDAFTADQIT